MNRLNAGTVEAVLTLDSSQFTGAINTARGNVKMFKDEAATASDKAKAVASSLKSVGTVLTATVTTSVIGAAAACVKASADLETGVNKVSTLADQSVLSNEAIKRGLQDLAAETGQSSGALADSLYNVLSATNDSANAMDYLSIATKTAVGGFTDANTAVDGLTTVMNSYGQSGKDAMASIADMMVTAQNFGKTTVGEIASTVGNVAATTASMGVGIDELMASLAVLTKNGLATASAVTGLKAAMSNIIKPTSDASEMAEELGLDFSATALASKGLTGFLQDVAAATGGDTEKMAALFGSVEALNAMLILTSDGGAKDFESAMTAMESSTGTVETAFETMSDGISAQMGRLRQSATGLMQVIGDGVAPYVSSLVGWVTNLTEGLRSMDEGTRNLVVTLGGVAAAIGPVLLIGGKAIRLLDSLRVAGAAVFTSPAGWVIGGVAAAAGLATGLYALCQRIRETHDVWGNLEKSFEKNDVKSIVDALTADFSGAVTVTGIPDAQGEIQAAYDDILGTLTDGLPDDAQTMAQLKERVHAHFQPLINAVDEQLQADIAALDPSDPEYGAKVKALTEQAGRMKADLIGAEQAYIGFVDTYAGASAATVQAHITELDQYKSAVVSTMEELKNLQKGPGQWAFESVRAGTSAATDTDSLTRAWNYIRDEQALQIKALEDERDAAIMELQSKGLDKEAYDAEAANIMSAFDVGKAEADATYKAKAQELVQGMFRALAETDPEAAQAGINLNKAMLLQEMLNGIYGFDVFNADPRMLGKSITNIQSIPSMLADYIAETTGDADWASKLSEGGMKALPIVNALIKSITGDMEEAGKEYSEHADNPVLTFLEALGLAGNLEAFDLDDDSTKEGIKTMFGDIGAAGVEGLVEAAEDTTDVVAAGRGIGSSLADATRTELAVQSPSKVFFDIGMNVDRGLAQGILSGQSEVMAAIRQVARAAAEAARRELDINSPSRVFFDIGAFTGKGFAMGIDQSTVLAEAASTRMANRTATAASSEADGMAPVGQGATINFSNTTVRSDSDIRRLARRLGQYLAANQYT